MSVKPKQLHEKAELRTARPCSPLPEDKKEIGDESGKRKDGEKGEEWDHLFRVLTETGSLFKPK